MARGDPTDMELRIIEWLRPAEQQKRPKVRSLGRLEFPAYFWASLCQPQSDGENLCASNLYRCSPESASGTFELFRRHERDDERLPHRIL